MAIQDLAVTTGKIGNAAVTNTKIGNNAVTEPKIADGAVSEPKIEDGAVTAPKIATGAVTELKIAADAVTEPKIAADAVTESKILDSAVTAPKINNGAVTEPKIGTGAVSTAKIQNDAVTLDKLAGGTPGNYIGFDGAGNPAELSGGSGGGSVFEFYDLGNDAWVFADGPGVTFAKNDITGELTYTIPDGVDIRSGGVLIGFGDTDSNQDAFLITDFQGSRNFNQGVATARAARIDVRDGKATPSPASPSFRTNTLQTAITDVGSGSLTQLLQDVGSTFPQILINFILP